MLAQVECMYERESVKRKKYPYRKREKQPITGLGAQPVQIMDKQSTAALLCLPQDSIIILNQRDLLSRFKSH